MGHVYVLKLRGGKWYVGYTDRSSAERILEHIEDKGSQWTKLHPPLKKGYLHNFTIPGKTRKDEDNYTITLMKRHGIENVRGGRWSFPEFYPGTIEELRRLTNKSKRKTKRISKTKHQCSGFSTKRQRCTVRASTVPEDGFCKFHLFQAPPRHPQYQGDPDAYRPGINDEGTLTNKQKEILRGHIYSSDGRITDRMLLSFGYKSQQWRKRWLVEEPKKVPKPSGRIITR